jgi:hypothetical protein
MSLQESFDWILSNYADARASQFGKGHSVYQAFKVLGEQLAQTEPVRSRSSSLRVQASVGQGNWAKVPWIALMDSRNTKTTQRGVYCVYLFREDMSGVYVTLNQGVTEPKRNHGTKEGREILHRRADRIRGLCDALPDEGFLLDHSLDLRASTTLGRDYEHSTIAHKLYPRGSVPDDTDLIQDLEAVLTAYDRFLQSELSDPSQPDAGGPPMPPEVDMTATERLETLVSAIRAQGFIFEPWHVAQYVTAVRTKPFCILAGVSGTGKSKLPALVAEATGCESRLIPVRPDWADSSDVLGYVDLQGRFRPGSVIEVMHQAMEEDDRFWICVVDEMNLARVEQYFAEVLSQMENRRLAPDGGYQSGRVLSQALPEEEDAEWAEVVIASNLAIVGTVNMDETTHGFSRKVLDRAFTIELSDVSLERWGNDGDASNLAAGPTTWPLSAWQPRAIQLSGLTDLTADEHQIIDSTIDVLQQANSYLKQAQLQVGYRTRDEVVLFVLHANEIPSSFVTSDGDSVAPVDLALHMKILPRIVGGSGAVRVALMGLLGWAHGSDGLDSEGDAHALVGSWDAAGRPGYVDGARFPRTAARLALMWERLQAEGYTSFWL